MQTSLRVSAETRDRLARVAAEDMGGSSIEEALRALLFEHESMKAIARLEADRPALADYQREAHEWAELDTAVTG